MPKVQKNFRMDEEVLQKLEAVIEFHNKDYNLFTQTSFIEFLITMEYNKLDKEKKIN